MREFSHNQSFHDTDGNLLHGMVAFYKKNTTDLQNIYNSDGEVLSNPILTDSIGQTKYQVFLDDTDYTVAFYKYIGEGDIETADVNDTSKWVFQYSCIDLYDKFTIEVEGVSQAAIDTIADLRNAEPDKVGNTVLLTGYYKAGDKPSIQYYWDSVSVDSDNGGSVIKVDSISVGRWKFIPEQTDEYDVRHFGAFPAMSWNTVSPEQTSAIQQAYNGISALGARLFFPKSSFGNGFYRVINTMGNARFDENVVVLVPDGYDITIDLTRTEDTFIIGQAPGYQGNIHLIGKVLKNGIVYTYDGVTADYSRINIDPTERFILDNNLTVNKTLEGIEVFIKASVKTQPRVLTLKSCTIVMGSKIGRECNVSLENCHVTESMFSSDNLLDNITFSSCYGTIQEWPTVRKYINFCIKNGESSIDLEGRTVAVSFTLPQRPMYLKNFNVSSGVYVIIPDNMTTLELQNCKIRLSMPTTRYVEVIAVDSEIELTGTTFTTLNMNNSSIVMSPSTDTPTITNLTLKNGSTFGALNGRPNAILVVTGTCNIDNSTMNAPLNVGNIANTPYFTDSNLMNQINTKVAVFKYNKIESNVYSNDNSGVIYFEMFGNVFGSNGRHYLIASTANTKVNGIWNGNTSRYGHPIVFDRTNLDPVENNHGYVYQNNSGLFIPSRISSTFKGALDVGINKSFDYGNETIFYMDAVRPSDPGDTMIAIWRFNPNFTHYEQIFAIGTEIDMDCTLAFMKYDYYAPPEMSTDEINYRTNGQIVIDGKNWPVVLAPFIARFNLLSGYNYKLAYTTGNPIYFAFEGVPNTIEAKDYKLSFTAVKH